MDGPGVDEVRGGAGLSEMRARIEMPVPRGDDEDVGGPSRIDQVADPSRDSIAP